MTRSLLLLTSIGLLVFPNEVQAQEAEAILLPIGAAPFTAHQPEGVPTSSGWVALGFRIDTKGQAYGVTVLASSGDPEIRSSATAAAQRWMFPNHERLEFACALALAQTSDTLLDLVALQKAFDRKPLCSLERVMVIPAGNTLLDDR